MSRYITKRETKGQYEAKGVYINRLSMLQQWYRIFFVEPATLIIEKFTKKLPIKVFKTTPSHKF
jgi:hypothetical protein